MELTPEQTATLAAFADALGSPQASGAGGTVVASVGAAVVDAIGSGLITPEAISDALGSSLINSMVVIQLEGALRRAEQASAAERQAEAATIAELGAQLEAARARRDGTA